MIETKHTPGPWYYSGDALTHRQFDIYAPGSSPSPHRHVATVNNLPHESLVVRDPEVALANACLIATAPELLKVLADLVEKGAIKDDHLHNQAIGALGRATNKAGRGARVYVW